MCFTCDYQAVCPSLWNRRVLRIKTHLDSKLEHGNVGQLLWKHRLSHAILRRGPRQDEAEAIRPRVLRIKTHVNTYFYVFYVWVPSGVPEPMGPSCFTYQNAPRLKTRTW